MRNIAKFVIVVNAVLALSYVISSYFLWGVVTGPNWSYYGAVASWSPLYVTPTYTQPMKQISYLVGSSIPAEMVNIPFLLFFAMSAVNIITIAINTKKYTVTTKRKATNHEELILERIRRNSYQMLFKT